LKGLVEINEIDMLCMQETKLQDLQEVSCYNL